MTQIYLDKRDLDTFLLKIKNLNKFDDTLMQQMKNELLKFIDFSQEEEITYIYDQNNVDFIFDIEDQDEYRDEDRDEDQDEEKKNNNG